MVALRCMTSGEYDSMIGEHGTLWDDYAETRARNDGTSLEEEREVVARQRTELLPQGMETPGHLFWMIVTETGEPVGRLWVHTNGEKGRAFIYDIEIEAAHRRKGYARAALAALEDQLRPLGIRQIMLNVFGDNAGAWKLYEHTGYTVAALHMRKAI